MSDRHGNRTGRVAVITGSSSGIGFATAQELGRAGYVIVMSGRDAARGEAAVLRLRGEGVVAAFVRCDVAVEEEVAALMLAAVDRFGAIDVLVNNAGPNGEDFAIGRVHEVPSGVFDRAMKVGSYGPFWCCKYAIPHMISGGGGAIVNLGAVTTQRSARLLGGYALSKALVETLGRQIADDYGADGIRCNTLLLGTIRPEPDDISTLPAGFDTSAIDGAIARTTMLGRTGRYREVAAAVRFLVSPESSFITGASIPIDGGAAGRLQYPSYHDAKGKDDDVD